ncbi:MAG: phosphate signaling complex protein PhoU [Polyangiaceae bacterium]|nr:phosphate signaling complex protein PhoU [Polyangiaceae bacterium]
MAGRVEGMIADAMRALEERDPELAARTIAIDRKVNRAELDIDERAMLILVKRNPMARDLRFVAVTFKMNTDLERIGDLAVNICERAADLAALPVLEPTIDLTPMANTVQKMVRTAMDAFVNWDSDRAESVLMDDDEVDEAYHQAMHALVATMIKSPATIPRCAYLQSVAKYLERIGDHATNLAEHVIFMVRAKDVRHHGKLGP